MSDYNQKLPIYRVNVLDRNNCLQNARLSQASHDDVYLASKTLSFKCNWENIAKNTSFGYEAIIKLAFQGNLMGLARVSLYSDNSLDDSIVNYLEIRNLECVQKSPRRINPVGLWLIWYSTKIALDYCTVNSDDDKLVVLDSLPDAIDYYREKVRMQGIGWTYSAPGEDCYAFMFTEKGARDFLARMERQYGSPELQPG
jgi:hypothetical protein